MFYFYIFNMIFINISADQILLSDWKDTSIYLERNDVETFLWKELIQIIKRQGSNEIIVLNWPGWFTNLRVGTLCLNVLNSLMNDKIDIFSISKTSLYYEAYKKWVLPRYWIIYIWQKKNVWVRDFKNNKKIWQYSFNELMDLEILNNSSEVFLDEVFNDKYYPERIHKYNIIKITFNWENLFVNNSEFSIHDLWISSIKSITPNYMMEPSITISNK